MRCKPDDIIYDSRFAYILNIIPHKIQRNQTMCKETLPNYQIYTKHYIRSGYRRNNLIRSLANDKGTAGD